ncbi:N-acetylglucosamine kinase [Streptomyces sp. SBT349]|uniref:N-acetylglucosamine kinase n=1 Tax=Streptomyces sp. SBT349 TaxID=1580539 RepID=UPI00069F53DA|nr:BadF/BadG/BcrA/BcrD ATPase family protein [Streptomyces sp. SBT349]
MRSIPNAAAPAAVRTTGPGPGLPAGAVTVAVDGGKTGCRAALFSGATRVATVEGPGLPHPDEPGAARVIAARVRALVDLLPEAAHRPAALVAGLTGVTGHPASAADLPARLRAAGADAGTVIVCGDIVTSYAGALGPRPGVVLAAGTGTIVLGVGPDARTAVVDGWGHLLGDAGSGWDIGRRALDLALREEDGRGGSPALWALAVRRFGPLHALPARLAAAERPAEAVAAFVPDVARAAAAGDGPARSLLADAGRELAAAVAAAAGLTHPHDGTAPIPVAWTGGLTRSGDLLTGPLARELAALLPRAALTPRRGDALDGALALARDPGPLHPLLHRAGSTPQVASSP